MKQLLLPFLALLFLMGCEKECTTELQPEQEVYKNESVTNRGSKRDVCHNGNIININVNAIPAHQAHGDAVDMDGDGFFDIDNPCSDMDCDDNNGSINPDALEICGDGIDNNCNDQIDEDCGCVEGELEVILPDGNILYVHPTDNDIDILWGQLDNDIDGLTNITSQTVANGDFNGASNTALIIADLGNWNGGDYAANLCATLSEQTGCDWYLPALGELNAMYQQLNSNPNNNFAVDFYLSSTEYNTDKNWGQNLFYSGQFYTEKSIDFRCRCVRR